MDRNLNIAVVDDDEAICRSLERLIRAAGSRAVTYASAEAFLDDAAQPRFDCLLLDVQLTGISGIELAERLVRSGSTMPVVFITSHDEPHVRARAREIPRAEFLLKTEPAEDLFAGIRRVIRRKVDTDGVG